MVKRSLATAERGTSHWCFPTGPATTPTTRLAKWPTARTAAMEHVRSSQVYLRTMQRLAYKRAAQKMLMSARRIGPMTKVK